MAFERATTKNSILNDLRIILNINIDELLLLNLGILRLWRGTSGRENP